MAPRRLAVFNFRRGSVFRLSEFFPPDWIFLIQAPPGLLAGGFIFAKPLFRGFRCFFRPRCLCPPITAASRRDTPRLTICGGHSPFIRLFGERLVFKGSAFLATRRHKKRSRIAGKIFQPGPRLRCCRRGDEGHKQTPPQSAFSLRSGGSHAHAVFFNAKHPPNLLPRASNRQNLTRLQPA